MTESYEWDWPQEKRSRRPRIQTVEILPPQQPEPEQRIHVYHHHRRPVRLPIWAIALLAFGVLAMMFPFGLVVSLVIVAISALMFPFQAAVFAIFLIVAAAIIVWDKRRRRRLGH
jgi:hypothetical protein